MSSAQNIFAGVEVRFKPSRVETVSSCKNRTPHKGRVETGVPEFGGMYGVAHGAGLGPPCKNMTCLSGFTCL